MYRDNDTETINFGVFSWSATFGGLIVALSVFLILMVFGLAVGLSAGDQSLGGGFGIWSAISGFAALFIGGWVMARANPPLSRMEAVVQGVLLWGLTVVSMLLLSIFGLNIGMDAALGVGQVLGATDNLGRIAGELGLNAEQMAALQERLGGATRTGAQAWWSFLAMAVSIVAVIFGAMVGTDRGEEGRRRTSETFAAKPT